MTAACPMLAYRVSLTFDPECQESALLAFEREWKRFLGERALECRIPGRHAKLRVVTSEAGQATDADRVATETWLVARRDIQQWTVGALFDLREE